MPDPIAANPPAPLAAGAPPAVPAVAPAASAVRTDPRLPEGVVVKDNLAADIDKYFAEDTPPPAAPPAAPAAPPAAVAPTPPEPKPGSLAAKLAAKSAPTPATPAAAPVAPVTSDDAVAKAEAEFLARDPKWKPATGWTTLKTTLKAESDRRVALEKELADTKAKLTAPTVAGASAQEIEELRAREKAASDRLMVMDLENHPTFRAQFVDPKNAEIARATELLDAHNVKVDVAALITKPRAELGKAVAEAIKDVPEFDRVEVAESIRKAHALHQNGQAALGQSKELAKSLQTQTVDRQRAAFASRWAPVSAAIGEFAQPIETPPDASPEQRAADAAYNASLIGLREKAETIALSPASDEAIAESAIKAAAYDHHVQQVLPRVISEYEQVVALNRQLVSELTALKGRNPNLNLRAPVGAGDTVVTDPKQMNHAQAAEHFYKG